VVVGVVTVVGVEMGLGWLDPSLEDVDVWPGVPTPPPPDEDRALVAALPPRPRAARAPRAFPLAPGGDISLPALDPSCRHKKTRAR
jgi:hypothetical protein